MVSLKYTDCQFEGNYAAFLKMSKFEEKTPACSIIGVFDFMMKDQQSLKYFGL